MVLFMSNQDYVIDPKAFKKARLDRDWTLERMADALNLHPATVYRIENGIQKPQERIAARIMRALPELMRTA